MKSKHLVDGKHSFQDLVDINKLLKIFEGFTESTGYPAALLSFPDQKILINTGWRKICTQFHRAFPFSKAQCQQSNFALTSEFKTLREHKIHECNHRLMDSGTPIIIRGAHIANIVTGQVLF